MTEQPKSFTDIMLEASQLASSLRGITHEHPDATWTQHPGDICGERTWRIDELADHLAAIHNVLGNIAETPNGYINQEALEGLREQFKPAIDFLATDWAKQVQQEADSRFLDSSPSPKQRRKRLQDAAPKLLKVIRNTLDDQNCTLDYERRVLLWVAITEATGEEPKLAD
jgi:hypothetical protein